MLRKHKETILILNHNTRVRDAERRRRRMITPIIYFLAEVVSLWLVLVLIQVNFNVLEWNFWAIVVYALGILYSIIKTVNVYQRQKDYSEAKEEDI